MERFVVYYQSGIFPYNIFNLDNEGLQKVVDAYHNGETKFYISGNTYHFGDVETIRIFQFTDPESSNGFESWARNNKGFIVIGPRKVVPIELLERIGPEVTGKFITDGYGARTMDQNKRKKIEKGDIQVESQDIFISHSSKDADIAKSLIRLIIGALKLKASQIICSSVDGYRLAGGAKITETLRNKIQRSKVMIAMLTTHSMQSTYVLFEMGARWANDQDMLPILCQPDDGSLVTGPLGSLNILDGTQEPQVHQVISELSMVLSVTPEPPSSYWADLKEFADICAHNIAPSTTTAVDSKLPDIEKNSSASLVETLSEKAKLMLRKTVEAKEPDIMVLEMENEYQIYCGAEKMDCPDHRAFTKWKSAINELLEYELIEFGSQGDYTIYRITEAGYDLADEIILAT